MIISYKAIICTVIFSSLLRLFNTSLEYILQNPNRFAELYNYHLNGYVYGE